MTHGKKYTETHSIYKAKISQNHTYFYYVHSDFFFVTIFKNTGSSLKNEFVDLTWVVACNLKNTA